ncbi:AAA family ATPase [uncultured Rubinisphaera sp.]|uniref:bifunctional aminoglycoside phosphotransferase/ATP-binding protein n=1 Tax=uncultured Rubinisphaera sp. TaxID=1678686 RepID=UPI0030D9EA65
MLNINALLNFDAFDHPVEDLQLIETHSAWVILTGKYAYKIKRPVDLGFLDFSTLEKRKFYCEQEIVLNNRLTQDLYIKIVPITRCVDHYKFDGRGETVEWAVKMHQFSQSALFSHLINAGDLTVTQIDALSQKVAVFHGEARQVDRQDDYGSFESISQAAINNFEVFESNSKFSVWDSKVRNLQQWTIDSLKTLEPVFEKRKIEGMVRECHGDLHLNNIIWRNQQVEIFDGIEFNPHLRWIDVINDLAFCLMDLEANDRLDLANRLLNNYLEQTGDYNGLQVLRFYMAYRAMVRAKVNRIRLSQNHEDDVHSTSAQLCEKYLNLAELYSKPSSPRLVIMHGLSASGKSSISKSLAEFSGAIRIRSDVERKRKSTDIGQSETAKNLYSQNQIKKTYLLLLELSHKILNSGYSVIVDATFLKQENRLLFLNLAKARRIPFAILSCTASEEELRRRLEKRGHQGKSVSDADGNVLTQQIASQDALNSEENFSTYKFDTEKMQGMTEVHQFWEEFSRVNGNDMNVTELLSAEADRFEPWATD